MNARAFQGLPRIPAISRLMERPCWVAWKSVVEHGKEKKPCINPKSGHQASVDKPSTWGSYEAALARAQKNKIPGVSRVLTADDDLIGIDLDKCVDPETGDLAPWAAEIVALGEPTPSAAPSARVCACSL